MYWWLKQLEVTECTVIDLESMWGNYSGFSIDVLNTYPKNLLWKLNQIRTESFLWMYSWILNSHVYFPLQQLRGWMPLSHQNVHKCKTRLCKALPLSKGQKACPRAPWSRKSLTQLCSQVPHPCHYKQHAALPSCCHSFFSPRCWKKFISHNTRWIQTKLPLNTSWRFPGSLTDVF